MVTWIGISRSKFYDWQLRYGTVNEHNCWLPRDYWLTEAERRAIIDYYKDNPLEGYRRLAYIYPYPLSRQKIEEFGLAKEHRIPLVKVRCMTDRCYRRVRKLWQGLAPAAKNLKKISPRNTITVFPRAKHESSDLLGTDYKDA
jgi:hypothetical protein